MFSIAFITGAGALTLAPVAARADFVLEPAVGIAASHSARVAVSNDGSRVLAAWPAVGNVAVTESTDGGDSFGPVRAGVHAPANPHTHLFIDVVPGVAAFWRRTAPPPI